MNKSIPAFSFLLLLIVCACIIFIVCAYIIIKLLSVKLNLFSFFGCIKGKANKLRNIVGALRRKLWFFNISESYDTYYDISLTGNQIKKTFGVKTLIRRYVAHQPPLHGSVCLSLIIAIIGIIIIIYH